MRKPVNAKQERFCQEYVIDCCGSRAAVRAGYSPRSPDNISRELLRKPAVRARIKELTDQKANECMITAEGVVSMILECYQGAKAEGDWAAALKATDQLGKHLGMFVDKTQVSGAVSIIWTDPPVPAG